MTSRSDRVTAPDHEQAERIIVALIPHKGHDGIPSAPEGVLCLRCNAERALSSLAAQLAEAKERLNREITEAEQRVGAAEMEREELNARWVEKWQRTVDLHVRELSEARAQLAEAQEALSKEARIHIRESARANTEKGRADRAEAQLAERERDWRLVERYCESFKDDDFRLVFKRGDEVLEISVSKDIWDSLATHSDSEERG